MESRRTHSAVEELQLSPTLLLAITPALQHNPAPPRLGVNLTSHLGGLQLTRLDALGRVKPPTGSPRHPTVALEETRATRFRRSPAAAAGATAHPTTPPPEPSVPPSPPVTLTLTALLGDGLTADVFACTHGLAVKVCAPGLVEEHVHTDTAECHCAPEKVWPPSLRHVLHTREGVVNEAGAYARLKDWEGRCVPRFYGVYSGVVRVPKRRGEMAVDGGGEGEGGAMKEVEVLVSVMQDVGGRVEVEEMTAEDRREIINLYEAIHGAGVVHGDVHLRHIHRPRPRNPLPLQRPLDADASDVETDFPSGLCLVDFDSAVFVGSEDDERGAAYRADERVRVEEMLGLGTKEKDGAVVGGAKHRKGWLFSWL